MYYGRINPVDIANGEGVRVTLFVSGCRNHCKGCFQPQTWEFDFGDEFTTGTEDYIIECLNHNYIKGLTLLGGDPMEPENQRALLNLLRRVKSELPDKDVWCYTGYTIEQILSEGHHTHCEVTDEVLSLMDTLVDGRFVEALKDITLRFRGSSNQRIINLHEYLT